VFAAVDGSAIRVLCARDHLVQLKTGAIAGGRLRPAVVDVSGQAPRPVKLADLDWRDAEKVDLSLLGQAAETLGPTSAPWFVAPASFSTLSSQRGRRLVLEQFEALGRRLKGSVAIEIRDLRGVPAGRLGEVVAQVRAGCNGVLGEVEPDRADIAAVAGCGLNGLSIRPRRDWTVDARQSEQFRALGELGRRIAPIVITRAFSPDNFEALNRAGFTHATIGVETMNATTQSAAA
jgi:hypothetical protein